MRPHSVPTALSELVWYWQVLPSPTPRKYASDVTSTGQRSSPSPCNSMKVGINFHVECKRRFLCAQLDMPRQMCSKNLSVSIETKYWVSWPGWREYELCKLQLNSLSGSVTAVWIGSEYRGDRTAEKRITAVSVGCTQSLSFRVHSNWETGASESARPSPRPLPRGRASRSLQSLNRKKRDCVQSAVCTSPCSLLAAASFFNAGSSGLCPPIWDPALLLPLSDWRNGSKLRELDVPDRERRATPLRRTEPSARSAVRFRSNAFLSPSGVPGVSNAPVSECAGREPLRRMEPSKRNVVPFRSNTFLPPWGVPGFWGVAVSECAGREPLRRTKPSLRNELASRWTSYTFPAPSGEL